MLVLLPVYAQGRCAPRFMRPVFALAGSICSVIQLAAVLDSRSSRLVLAATGVTVFFSPVLVLLQ
jgi:hypothetical protein